MEMHMTFYWGYDATILFPWWECSTALEFYISCFCIFLLCLGSSKLKATCHEIQGGSPKGNQILVLTGCSAPSISTAARSPTGVDSSQSPVTENAGTWRRTPSLLQANLSPVHYSMDPGSWAQTPEQREYGAPDGRQQFCSAKTLAVWLLVFITVTIDWAMMLVCMTFNGGLFLAVVSGVATGQLLLQRSSDRSFACCSDNTHG